MTHVLYAEDDPQVSGITELYFARHVPNWTIDVVPSGRECLRAMERGGYDVLLLDLMMPDLNGLQVLGELTARRDPTPVIMVSGHGQAELAVRALRAGAAGCIDKNSTDFRRIHEIIRHTLSRRGPAPSAAASAEPPRQQRVLLLDPDPAQRKSAEEFFRHGAPHLALAAEPPSALEDLLAGETAFDAVVLGPQLETAAMIGALRHLLARQRHVPVIVVAASASAEIAIAAFKLGAHDFLLEGPGVLAELVFSLNQALRLADATRPEAQPAAELAAQLAARTHELETEVIRRCEAERRAQEVFDQIGPLLTGLQFRLGALRAGHPGSAFGEALAQTGDLLGRVRALQLRRPILADTKPASTAPSM
jgi:DNA-binding NtrC family response regulator